MGVCHMTTKLCEVPRLGRLVAVTFHLYLRENLLCETRLQFGQHNVD